MSLLTLCLKAIIILLLLNLADIAYHTYNNNYPTIEFFSINSTLLLTIIGILLLNRLWIRITLLTIILFVMLITYYYFQYFGTYVQPIAFYQMFTETDEVIVSFIDEFPSMEIPTLIIVALFFSIFVMKTIKSFNSYRNTIFGILILLSIFSLNFYDTHRKFQHTKSGKILHKNVLQLLPLPYLHSTNNFMRSFYYFIVEILPKKVFSNNIILYPALSPPKIEDTKVKRNIILIIGESLRAQNVALLGYTEDTTPKLNQRDKLLYKSIYSAGTMTKTSVSALLNRVKYPGATIQINNQKNNLFHLAKQNGFTTHFYSNQTNYQLQILQNYIGKQYIDNYASKQILRKKLKKANTYDIVLEQALETVDFNKENHFIVLQQRGSHTPYHKQYPKEFKKFKTPYDNTVLYTDHVLNEIITYIESVSDKPTYIIFTSDHGELLREHGRNGHGWFFEEVYKVPFFFCGIQQNKDRLQTFSLSNINSHFDVSNLVTKLLGYNINITNDNNIYINGTDIDALAGYLHIKLDSSGNQKSINEIR